MSTESTKTMLAMYNQNRSPETFFASMFGLRTFNSQSVEIDIERTDEDVAIAITDMSQDGRTVSLDRYTNKEFTPPIFDENTPLNSYDMILRQAGDNPFKSPNFLANAAAQTMRAQRHLANRARRAYELQASQVMQTGTATLIDNDGNTVFSINYSPKASHFPTAGTTAGYGAVWDAATGTTPVADVLKLTNQIRDDGLADPTTLLFGSLAFEQFLEDVRTRYDTIRINQGEINPFRVRAGAQFRGNIELGNYQYDLWTYNARYVHPQSGTKTPYLDPVKVIAMSMDSRRDAAFGAIPKIVEPDQRIRRFIPVRRLSGGGMDMFTDGWVSQSGKNISVSVASRGLYIPVAIDQYGCLNTGITP
jgi:hypothetical protein